MLMMNSLLRHKTLNFIIILHAHQRLLVNSTNMEVNSSAATADVASNTNTDAVVPIAATGIFIYLITV